MTLPSLPDWLPWASGFAACAMLVAAALGHDPVIVGLWTWAAVYVGVVVGDR